MADEDKGFNVNDKRGWVRDESGNFVKRDEEKSAQPQPEAQPGEPEKQKAPTADSSGEKKDTIPLPDLNFATFILTLNTSALVHLGLLADPQTNQKAPDLPLARQTIDLISLMEEKTQGNLDSYEKQLISQVLYELRLRYVSATKASS